MKEIWKEMWTVGRQQEISVDEGADDNDDESIVSALRIGDTIICGPLVNPHTKDTCNIPCSFGVILHIRKHRKHT